MNIQLNEEQRKAVESPPGVTRILASPGSGKTAVLVHRVKYLLDVLNVNPAHILLLTFTRKAALEMSERLKLLVGEGRHSKLTVSTFHSVGYRILSQYLWDGTGFKLISDVERIQIIKRIISGAGLKMSSGTGIGEVLRTISLAKANLLTPPEYMEQNRYDEDAGAIAQIYELYDKAKEEQHTLDYDDLLFRTESLLSNDQSVLEYQQRYRHILCDEAQDNNRAQAGLLSMIANPHNSLMVVADDDQSIHKFRGASSDYVLNLEKAHDAKTIILKRNYRNTRSILTAASNLIRRNIGRIPKELHSENPEGEPVTVKMCADAADEARWVSQEARSLVKSENIQWKEIAVLYRTNNQSMPIEDRFTLEKIPYEVIGSSGFYARKDIQVLINYLKVIHAPDENDEPLLSILNVPNRYLGTKVKREIEAYAAKNEVSCFRALGQMPFERMYQSLSVRRLLSAFQRLRTIPAGATVGDVIYEVIDTFKLEDHFRDTCIETEDCMAGIEQLIRKASEFVELKNFLSQVAIRSGRNTGDPEGVKLLSIHASKGLEFPVVFIIGCNENILPHKRSIEASKLYGTAIEEERRLCYVGMTRAEHRLYMSYVTSNGNQKMEPSRFLNEAFPDRTF